MIQTDLVVIRRVYPQAIVYDSINGARDADGNYIELDPDLIASATAEQDLEDAWTSLRRHRNRLLAETDWVTLKAVDASIDGSGVQLPDLWMTYRQQLRDLPANTSDPRNPSWPTKPQ